MTPLVLSVFGGLGLLSLAFQRAGFCVVEGPDLLWCRDVRGWVPPAGKFDGVIGGPPCQSFSALIHLIRANGHEPRHGNQIPEFERVVAEAAPAWFLMENVPAAPEPVVPGFAVRSMIWNNRWTGAEQKRLRRFSFGTHDGRSLLPDVALFEAPVVVDAVISGNGSDGGPTYRQRPNQAVTATDGGLRPSEKPAVDERYYRPRSGTVTANNGGRRTTGKTARYSVQDALRLQGLPEDFLDESPFTAGAKLQMVANGVPLDTGEAMARAVWRAMGYAPESTS